ncbi:hypothetical protein PtA15_8A129 [Puccinia triticina]|uniref:Uncharacterized protein n=1 Tax=Puccinia triticina TaxID=208348 RepID=A0ABY7CTD5_9BASI|nr:uncharacterized protein PtA15_8A129 [Puccinia triticina]WAQ87227.1 hypothetical protein PtA15_8A129 [Puccinia triticina]WAR57072.1 hypothetical protein PtB15_8B117 [Puccinia triticina]
MLQVFGLDELRSAVDSTSSVIMDRPVGDLVDWNFCKPAEPKAVEYWIQRSSFHDQVRKTARQKKLKKAADPSSSTATVSLTDGLNQLCQQLFRNQL